MIGAKVAVNSTRVTRVLGTDVWDLTCAEREGRRQMCEKFEDCIRACNECAVECEPSAGMCLQEDDVKMMARCIALDHDGARICYSASAFMASGSEFAEEICRICAGAGFGEHSPDVRITLACQKSF